MNRNKDNSSLIFLRLRGILQKHSGKFSVTSDRPDHYCLSLPWSPKFNKGFPIAWVKVSKSYVSYHFMPIYMLPKLMVNVPLGLKRRMQGKSCFNFKNFDESLLNEIEHLTVKGFEECKKVGIVP